MTSHLVEIVRQKLFSFHHNFVHFCQHFGISVSSILILFTMFIYGILPFFYLQWLNTLKSELIEAKWFRNNYLLGIDEYGGCICINGLGTNSPLYSLFSWT